MDGVVEALERIGIALGIVIAGYVIAALARAVARRAFKRSDAVLGPSFVRLVCSSLSYWILALAVGGALIALGVPVVIVGGVLLAILVVLAIALQESVADLAATVVILVFRPFRRGDLIEAAGYMGTVHEILAF